MRYGLSINGLASAHGGPFVRLMHLIVIASASSTGVSMPTNPRGSMGHSASLRGTTSISLRGAHSSSHTSELSDLDQLGGDQLGDAPCFVIGEAAVEDGDRTIRLAVDMRQDHAAGIDNPVSARHRFDGPGLRKEARRHGRG
jgi:hypothetical protein